MCHLRFYLESSGTVIQKLPRKEIQPKAKIFDILKIQLSPGRGRTCSGKHPQGEPERFPQNESLGDVSLGPGEAPALNKFNEKGCHEHIGQSSQHS
jgi:hypothetical protein